MSGPSDKRSEFFKDYYSRALTYDQFVASGNPGEQERWRKMAGRINLTAEQKKLAASFTRRMNVLVLAGTWCGDCVRECPMLRAIESAASTIFCRFVDNQLYPELRDELRICGGTRVPAAVFLSEDFFEAARFGDRTLSVYRRKAALELGPACETGLVPPEGHELEAETGEWLDIFERVNLMLRLSPFLRGRYND